MSNLIRGEFYKLRKSKYFISIILLSLVAGLVLMLQLDYDIEVLQSVRYDIVNGVYSVSYAFYFIVGGSFLFALLGGEFIAKDFKNNNINSSFIYGYTRNQVLLSKLIVFIIFCLFLEVIYSTILVIYVSVNHGFYDVLNLSTILYLIRVIIVGIMYNVATMCIIFMISIITKSIFFTFASPFILWISFSVGDSHIGPYIFSYMPYVVGRQATSKFASESDIIMGIISSLLTFIITIGVSILYVRHKDIK